MSAWREFRYLKQLFGRFVGLLSIWALCRLAFYIFNSDSFPTTSPSEFGQIFFFGIRFDLAAIAYVNLLFAFLSLLPFPFRSQAFFQNILKLVFISFNGIALLFEIADIGYFPFSFRRFIGSDFSLLSETPHLFTQFLGDFWYLALLYLILVALLFLLFERTQIKSTTKGETLWKQVSLFIIGMALIILGARGGWQIRPLMALNAAQYVKDMRLISLQSNSTLNLLFSAQQKFIEEKFFFEEQALKQIFLTKKKTTNKEPFKKKNIFIIVLESFGQEAVGFFNSNPTSYTPFLDSLIQKSWYFENAFANGTRSTQGIAAITAGVPALMEDPIMFSAYQGNQLNGIPNLLQSKGYSSAFFHGSNPGSMEFDQFSKLVGYQKSYDRTHYPNQEAYDGQWGIWDDPFFQFTISEINKLEQPFTSLLFSLTSHHPYQTEQWFEEKFPDDDPILRSIRYTDYSLQHFFAEAKNTDWFDETLFIITADHTGQSKNQKYQTNVGRYRIPLLFYHPNSNLKRKDSKVIQQLDILPTVLDYLNYDQNYLSFGQSAFDTLHTGLAFNYSNGIYQLITDSLSLTSDLDDPIGLFRYQTDSLLRQNLKSDLSKDVNVLEIQLKAIVQTHHQAMIHNQLIIRKK